MHIIQCVLVIIVALSFVMSFDDCQYNRRLKRLNCRDLNLLAVPDISEYYIDSTTTYMDFRNNGIEILPPIEFFDSFPNTTFDFRNQSPPLDCEHIIQQYANIPVKDLKILENFKPACKIDMSKPETITTIPFPDAIVNDYILSGKMAICFDLKAKKEN